MKKLEKKIIKILKPTLAKPAMIDLPLEAGALDIISDIMKAITEYKHEVEEAACYLLELLPNNAIITKSDVTDTCTLVYSVSKE